MSKFFIATLLMAGILTTVASCQEQEQEQEQEGIPAWTGPKDAKEVTEPGKMDEDAPTEFKKTESGLKYRILRAGDKDNKPTADNTVTVHYKGWLDDKSIFDSSYQRGETISFPLGRVVKGWTEGLQLVGKGGMIELEIPAELGYGARGAGAAVPPNATLHFLVELYEIE